MTPARRCVLFDAGQTLISVAEPVGETYAKVAAQYGVKADPLATELAFRRVWEVSYSSLEAASSSGFERQWWHGLVARIFSEVGVLDDFRGGFEEFFEEQYAFYMQPAAWSVYDDVHVTLQTLSQRNVRCAVVSNWDSRLPELLDLLGLAQYFEFILTSAEAGFRKPDRRIFDHALNRLGLSAPEVIHVGDSYVDDHLGATQAGILPLVIDRHAMETRVCTKISSLTDVPQWVTLEKSVEPRIDTKGHE